MKYASPACYIFFIPKIIRFNKYNYNYKVATYRRRMQEAEQRAEKAADRPCLKERSLIDLASDHLAVKSEK